MKDHGCGGGCYHVLPSGVIDVHVEEPGPCEDGEVYVELNKPYERIACESTYDGLMTMAGRLKTAAIELENLALSHKAAQ